MRQLVQGCQGGDLAKAVDVVAVANFIERSDQLRLAYEVADALKAKRVSLRECAGGEHVRMLQRQAERILGGKIDISLIQHNDASLSAAQFIQLRYSITSATGGIGRRDEGQRRPEIPFSVPPQL